MKFIDILKIANKDTLIGLNIQVCGITFRTEHFLEYYLDTKEEKRKFFYMEVKSIEVALNTLEIFLG